MYIILMTFTRTVCVYVDLYKESQDVVWWRVQQVRIRGCGTELADIV